MPAQPANDLSRASASPEHRTVTRIMAILEVVVASASNGLRLADLPDMVGAPKSTIHGLARGLLATGYIREKEGRYYEGPALAALGGGPRQASALYHRALESLVKEFHETAVLATLAGASVINIDIVEPDQTIRASPPLHQRRPMWPGSYGKVFLAHMDERRRDNLLRRQLPDARELPKVVAELNAARDLGFATNRGESDPELYGVAAPIASAGLGVTLAIGLAGPANRMADRLDEMGDAVRRIATELSTTEPDPR